MSVGNHAAQDEASQAAESDVPPGGTSSAGAAGDPPATAVVPDEATERFHFPRAELRRRTLRGVSVNAVFLVLADGLVLAQGLIVTSLLAPDLIGLYGIVTITVMSILRLKQVGIDEAFVQQQEQGQAKEFQRAFTLELLLAGSFALGICVLAPIVALIYGDERLLPLMLATAYLPIAFALQAPVWVYFRRMDFVRQRVLQGLVPIVTFCATIPLVLAGLGVWSLVIGPAIGSAVGAAAAIAASPYPLRLRFDRARARRYVSFSAPVLLVTLAMLLVEQGTILAFNLVDGLAGAGFVTVAFMLTRYVDRADQIVIVSMYPAICAIQGKTERLTEVFIKSNRATMLYSLPFAAGLVLFAPDLVHFVLGDKWDPAIVLIQGLAIATGLAQITANWFAFYRAHGDTWPTAIEALTTAAGLLLLAVPGLVLWGTVAFVVGRVIGVLITLALRRHYVRRMLPAARLAPLVLRPLRPLALAVGVVVVARLVTWGGERDLTQAIVELVAYLAVYTGTVLWFERPLLLELRRTWGDPAATSPAPEPV